FGHRDLRRSTPPDRGNVPTVVVTALVSSRRSGADWIQPEDRPCLGQVMLIKTFRERVTDSPQLIAPIGTYPLSPRQVDQPGPGLAAHVSAVVSHSRPRWHPDTTLR